jgi:hypothetical protein
VDALAGRREVAPAPGVGRRLVRQAAVGPHVVVLVPPCAERPLGVREIGEPVVGRTSGPASLLEVARTRRAARSSPAAHPRGPRSPSRTHGGGCSPSPTRTSAPNGGRLRLTRRTVPRLPRSVRVTVQRPREHEARHPGEEPGRRIRRSRRAAAYAAPARRGRAAAGGPPGELPRRSRRHARPPRRLGSCAGPPRPGRHDHPAGHRGAAWRTARAARLVGRRPPLIAPRGTAVPRSAESTWPQNGRMRE